MHRDVKFALTFFALLLIVGTAGFSAIEHWSVLDSLYMTVITLSTVGYGELRPLSPAGKIFTSALILFGVGNLAYAATKTTEALLERGVIRHRRMQMEIKRLRNHAVVCGYGRMGATVCEDLKSRGFTIVVIERKPDQIEVLSNRGILHVAGDATDDATLQRAGVDRARALAVVLPNDADNLFVTLTARGMSHGLTIVARASIEKNESKMYAAGASRVLNPYRQGGRMIVRQMMHPAVTEFFDMVSSTHHKELDIEEIRLEEGSSLTGVMLRDAPIRKEMDVIVVAVRRPDQDLIFNPPHDLAPQVGDILIALGTRDNLQRLEELAAARN